MCAIAGIQGENISRDILRMLETLKHRGIDGSGVFSGGGISYGVLDKSEILEGNFALGHNLLSIVGTEGLQPLTNGKLVLVCNGEIYNFRELKRDFNLQINSDSDCEVILALISKFYHGSLLDALKEAIKYLDGDYAFAVYDGVDLAVIRDPVGVKPVYYGVDQNIHAFASERKAIWEIGIRDVETLPPGYMLYNWELLELEENFKTIRESSNAKFNQDLKDNTDVKSYLKKQLEIKLIDSVKKRLKGLSRVGVMFSGGIDSTILAYLSREMEVETTLYCVGHENSPDFKFAQKTAKDMGLPIRLRKVTMDDVRDYLPLVLNAIEEFNLMKLGVGMSAYMAAEMAREDGIKVMLSGQGADELFAGYHRYLKFYQEQGEEAQENLNIDIDNLYQVNLQRDDAVTMASGVELRVPYLDLDVINMAMNIPMEYKINGEDDSLRKCILREVARDLGVPEENVKRPKKAAQYGSGIDKMLRRVLKDTAILKNEDIKFYI
jgi:asparagine synthase (glutamine-hydrolysing)